MPQNHGGFRQTNPRYTYRKRPNAEEKKNVAEIEETNNPILKSFHGYARELDTKHDRHERIVKLSRDITIEAKRIIFLLHTIDGRKNNRAKILEEAQQRLNNVIEINFKAVAKELLGQDPYQHRSAYSPGLQEFIEAYTFFEYYKQTEVEEDGCGTLSDWSALQQRMQYVDQDKIKVEEVEKVPAANEQEAAVAEKPPAERAADAEAMATEVVKFEFFVDPTEYILGVSDLTGELMRRCINSLGSGETDVCLETCKVLQDFYTGYISLSVQRCRELSRKIYTMRQSVLKAENVCYNVKVRGGEAAKWGAVYDSKLADDVDEGFY